MRFKYLVLASVLALQGLGAAAFAADALVDSTQQQLGQLRKDAASANEGQSGEFRYWGEKTGGAPAATGLEAADRAIQSKSFAQGVTGGVEKDVGSTTVGAAVTAGSGAAGSRELKSDNYDYKGVTVYQKARDAATGAAVDMSASYASGSARQGDAAGSTSVYSVGSQVSAPVYDGAVKIEPFAGASVNRIDRTGSNKASGTSTELPLGINVTGAKGSAAGFAIAPRASISAAPVMGDEAVTNGETMRYRSGVGVSATRDGFTLDLDARKEQGNVEKSNTTIMLRAKQRF